MIKTHWFLLYFHILESVGFWDSSHFTTRDSEFLNVCIQQCKCCIVVKIANVCNLTMLHSERIVCDVTYQNVTFCNIFGYRISCLQSTKCDFFCDKKYVILMFWNV